VNRRDLLRSLAAASVAVPVAGIAGAAVAKAPLALAPLPHRAPDPALFDMLKQAQDGAMVISDCRGIGPTSAQFRAAMEPHIRRAHEAVYDKHAAEWEEVFK
jgi:hypothetical protein